MLNQRYNAIVGGVLQRHAHRQSSSQTGLGSASCVELHTKSSRGTFHHSGNLIADQAHSHHVP
jgi:hypothetical protein